MVGLLLFSLPFAIVSARSGRGRTVALPLIVWGGLAVLQWVGVLSLFSGSAASMLVVSGTLFSLAGLAFRRSVQRRAVRPIV